MKPKKLDPQRVVLVPADENALQIGVGAATEPGLLSAYLTVNTSNLGEFVIPVSAEQLGLLAAASNTLLSLDAAQVDRLRDELSRANTERNDHE